MIYRGHPSISLYTFCQPINHKSAFPFCASSKLKEAYSENRLTLIFSDIKKVKTCSFFGLKPKKGVFLFLLAVFKRFSG